MGQLIALFAEGLETLGVPLAGLLLSSIRPALTAVAILAGFAAGFGIGAGWWP